MQGFSKVLSSEITFIMCSDLPMCLVLILVRVKPNPAHISGLIFGNIHPCDSLIDNSYLSEDSAQRFLPLYHVILPIVSRNLK